MIIVVVASTTASICVSLRQHGRRRLVATARFVQVCINPAALDTHLSRRDNPHKLSNCYFGEG